MPGTSQVAQCGWSSRSLRQELGAKAYPMRIVMKKKGAGLADITEVPPTRFVTDLTLGTRES